MAKNQEQRSEAEWKTRSPVKTCTLACPKLASANLELTDEATDAKTQQALVAKNQEQRSEAKWTTHNALTHITPREKTRDSEAQRTTCKENRKKTIDHN